MSNMPYERERQVAIAAAQQAGAVALSMQGRCAVSEKADASVVTEADYAADALIRGALAAAFPDDALLSEETAADGQRLHRQRVWIIDPIDGTKGFVEGESEWAIHIALVEAGELVLGVVATPAAQRIVSGVPGHGLWELRAGEERALPQDLLTATALPADSTLILSRRQYDKPHAALAALPFSQRMWTHSVGVKVLALLDGKGQAYVHPAPLYDWDAAAPMALVLAANGCCTSAAGSPLQLNGIAAKVPSFLAANAPLHADFVDVMRRAGYGDQAL